MPELPKEAVTKCNYVGCEGVATRVMALRPGVARCVHVAPFCTDHADGVLDEGGLPAGGPALSESVRDIEGIRR
jgi:hypothetical protein